MVKVFAMKHCLGFVETFTEEFAPDYLTSKNTVRGSTMDNRWFWNDHVLTLKVGQFVETDFSKIYRVI